jgi:hypothetical protein
MLTHPKDFAQSQAYQLTGLLYYSWNADLGSLGYENIKMHNFLDGMIPDMRTKIIAAMQERKRLLDENEAIPRLGFRAEDA